MIERPTPETDDLLNIIRKLECELAEVVKARDHNRTCVKRLAQERDEARELARELRDKLQLASGLLERAGRENATTWEPGQSWIFWEDKCAAKNDVEAIRQMLTKAKEVLP
jgi:hypothetical protein